jgi:predicted LPLAT superfamily acyltransferase
VGEGYSVTPNYCVVVPIYNHKETIARVVDVLVQMALPVIIVDDGSGADTKHTLGMLTQQHDAVQLVTLSANQGKGGAVMAGLKQASACGFSHAVQVDADGQHNLDDVPRLLRLSQQYPLALVSGRPTYDASVPKGRYYSRYLTHVWVWIETLSFDIADSMCGFRVYPLASTMALLDQCRLGKRMDFDIEVIVRLYWRAVPVISMPTRVIYPPGGISHFRAWKDNVLISWLHTRLFFGMLFRLPMLLSRRVKSLHWSSVQEQGTVLGMYAILAIYRLLGRRLCRIVVQWIVFYYYLVARGARSHSAHYLSQVKRFAWSRGVALQDGLTPYKHFLQFSYAALDKIGIWIDHAIADQAKILRKDEVSADLAKGRGVLLMGSHLGNLEICRALVSLSRGVRVTALVYTEHAEKFNKVLRRFAVDDQVNLVSVSALTPEIAMDLVRRVDEGEVLVVAADRVSVHNPGRSVFVPFLGVDARFPEGPWILAHVLRCPVYLVFCMWDNGYQISFEPFAHNIVLPRQRREIAVREYVERYVTCLQEQCLRYPLQWFNFFDFWSHKGQSSESQQ